MSGSAEQFPCIEDVAVEEIIVADMVALQETVMESGGGDSEGAHWQAADEGAAVPGRVVGKPPATSHSSARIHFRRQRAGLDDAAPLDIERVNLEAHQQGIREIGARFQHYRDAHSLRAHY